MNHIIVSNNMKMRFCKDNSISLQLFDEPYFEERLLLFDKLDKYDAFKEFLEHSYFSLGKCEDDFLHDCNIFRDDVINFIKTSSAFIELNTCDMNQYAFNKQYPRGDSFKPSNVGYEFISIDMNKANFSAFVHFAKENNLSFHDNYDYASFISQFTDMDYLMQSKYIRQVVFGACNPPRQITYEKFLTEKLFNDFLEFIDLSALYSLSHDEIILRVEKLSIDQITKLKETISAYQVPFSFEHYRIGKVENTDGFVKKIFNDDLDYTYELAFLGPIESVFAHRAMKHQEITEHDLVFMQDNKRMAKLLEKPNVFFNFERDDAL